jgi:endonuclease YncB( thermonuclease family)
MDAKCFTQLSRLVGPRRSARRRGLFAGLLAVSVLGVGLVVGSSRPSTVQRTSGLPDTHGSHATGTVPTTALSPTVTTSSTDRTTGPSVATTSSPTTEALEVSLSTSSPALSTVATLPSTTSIPAMASLTVAPSSDHGSGTATIFAVARVIDGDTIVLSDGTHVRLLNIDTPEVGTCGADRATVRLRELIDGELVVIETDTHEWDQYGRLLAHVTTKSGLWINEAMLREGLATSNLFRKNGSPENATAYNYLASVEQAARNESTGSWALGCFVQPTAPRQLTPAPQPTTSRPSQPPVAVTSPPSSGCPQEKSKSGVGYCPRACIGVVLATGRRCSDVGDPKGAKWT